VSNEEPLGVIPPLTETFEWPETEPAAIEILLWEPATAITPDERAIGRKPATSKKRRGNINNQARKTKTADPRILDDEFSPENNPADISAAVALSMEDWSHVYRANAQYRQRSRPGASKKKCMEVNKRTTFVLEDFLTLHERIYSHHLLLQAANTICVYCDAVDRVNTIDDGWDILHNNEGKTYLSVSQNNLMCVCWSVLIIVVYIIRHKRQPSIGSKLLHERQLTVE
jgi:hypothetical protein